MWLRFLIGGAVILGPGGCFESATPVTPDRGSSSAADTGTPTSTGSEGETTGPNPDDSGPAETTENSGTTASVEGSSTVAPATDTRTAGSEFGDASSTGAESSSGGTTEPCVAITEDANAIGANCAGDTECPPGYTCQPYSGIVVQYTCQILCEKNCDCPRGHACSEIMDKGDTWSQCTAGGRGP